MYTQFLSESVCNNSSLTVVIQDLFAMIAGKLKLIILATYTYSNNSVRYYCQATDNYMDTYVSDTTAKQLIIICIYCMTPLPHHAHTHGWPMICINSFNR